MNVVLFLYLSLIQLLLLPASDTLHKVYAIEDFESGEIGGLPIGWFNQKGNLATKDFSVDLRPTYNYQILEEQNNKFLRFEGTYGKHMSYPLINKEGIDIFETPMLSWKWRVHQAPKNANEDDDDRNDVAASIYVAFDMGRVALFKKVPKTIRYTWSSTLPEGTELSKFYGNQKIVVMGQGDNTNGDWKSFSRNIVEDYKRLFGDDPPAKPIAILILSDANNTNSPAKADYDDIMLHSSRSN